MIQLRPLRRIEPATSARRWRPAVAAALFASSLVPIAFAHGASTCAHLHQNGSWLTIDSPFTTSMTEAAGSNLRPEFAWDGTLNLVAVDPKDSNRIFATDGVDLERSVDRGCTWQPVFTTGAQGHDAPALYVISRIAIAGSGRSSHVYLVLQSNFASHEIGNARNQVATSTNGGGSFTTAADTSLPQTGTAAGSCAWLTADQTAIDLATVPTNPSQLYLLCNNSPSPSLYLSTDSAHSWTQVTSVGLPYWTTFAPMTVSPVNPRNLWVAAVDGSAPTHRGVWRSNDGGRTFDEMFKFPEAATGQESSQVSLQTYLPPRAKASALQILATNETAAALSLNAGRKWTVLPSPPMPSAKSGPIISAAFGPRLGEVTVITAYGSPSGYYRGTGTSAQAGCGEATLAWSYSIAKKRWTALAAPSIASSAGGHAIFGLAAGGGSLYGIARGLSSPCAGGSGFESPHIVAYTAH
ncbi:MAG: Sortilin, neurotensin receptor 3 [Frankiaceae bacterium]|nr:Sortilin, neurotensin receptor 3 [Frankiaceae bacterium]